MAQGIQHHSTQLLEFPYFCWRLVFSKRMGWFNVSKTNGQPTQAQTYCVWDIPENGRPNLIYNNHLR